MARNVLAAPIARPQDLKYRRLERLDGLVDERSVLRQQLLLLFDNRKMPVEVAGLFERAAQLVALRQIVEQGAFLRLMAVNFQAEHAEAGIIQAAADNFKRGELLGNEEHGFASGKRSRDEVRDGLRFAGARRTFDDQILPTKRVNQGAVLRAVGVPDEMRDVSFQLGRINRVFFGKRDIGVLRAFKQFAHQRVLGDTLAGGQVFGSRSRYIRSLPKLRSARVICRRMDQAFLSFRISANFAK